MLLVKQTTTLQCLFLENKQFRFENEDEFNFIEIDSKCMPHFQIHVDFSVVMFYLIFNSHSKSGVQSSTV
jgi:hypothetical protein